LRLGLVIYGGLETVSGGYLYDRKLVEHLRRCGDEVEVISLPWPPYGRALLDNFSPVLLHRLSRGDFQVLLQDELAHPSFFLLNRRLRRRVAYPLVSIVHHLRCCEARPAWQNILYRQVERQYLTSLDGFICNSRATRAAVEGLAAASKPAIVASPGGDRLPGKITAAQVAARALAPGPLQIISVANLIPRKQVHTLISALSGMPRQDWELTVAGSLTMDRTYSRDLRRRIEQAGLGAKISLLGTVDDKELAALLLRRHLLAVPSSYEGFGIVYLEAMRFGLPVLASAAGGAREIVSHGVNGFLVEPGDTAALARYLQGLMEDRDRLARMSLAALESAVNHPTWEAGAARVRQFLQTFIN